MEKPLDGGEVDLEGFGLIVVGDGHRTQVEALAARLHQALDAAVRCRDTHTEFR